MGLANLEDWITWPPRGLPMGQQLLPICPPAGEITVDMTKVAGKEAKAWWFDPRTGKSHSIGTVPTSGKHKFAPPG